MLSTEDIVVLKNSVVGKDFIKHKVHPKVDTFLDYRLSLQDMLDIPVECKEYPDAWCKQEIAAVDVILRQIS